MGFWLALWLGCLALVGLLGLPGWVGGSAGCSCGWSACLAGACGVALLVWLGLLAWLASHAWLALAVCAWCFAGLAVWLVCGVAVWLRLGWLACLPGFAAWLGAVCLSGVGWVARLAALLGAGFARPPVLERRSPQCSPVVSQRDLGALSRIHKCRQKLCRCSGGVFRTPVDSMHF